MRKSFLTFSDALWFLLIRCSKNSSTFVFSDVSKKSMIECTKTIFFCFWQFGWEPQNSLNNFRRYRATTDKIFWAQKRISTIIFGDEFDENKHFCSFHSEQRNWTHFSFFCFLFVNVYSNILFQWNWNDVNY